MIGLSKPLLESFAGGGGGGQGGQGQSDHAAAAAWNNSGVFFKHTEASSSVDTDSHRAGNSNTLFPLPTDIGGSSSGSTGLVRLPMRRESPVEFSHGTHYMEPPFKRKSTNLTHDGGGGRFY